MHGAMSPYIDANVSDVDIAINNMSNAWALVGDRFGIRVLPGPSPDALQGCLHCQWVKTTGTV